MFNQVRDESKIHGTVDYRVWFVKPGQKLPLKPSADAPALAEKKAGVPVPPAEKQSEKLPEKIPPPNDAQQKAAEKTIKEIFKDDYTKTSTAERAAFAKKLFDQAARTNDDASAKFVLLREARDIAALAPDLDLALKAENAIDLGFTVNALADKAALVKKALDAATARDNLSEIMLASFTVMREAILADRFDITKQLSGPLDFLASRVGVPLLAAQSKEINNWAADGNATMRP